MSTVAPHLRLLLSSLLFGLMSVLARQAAAYMPTAQLVLVRNLVGLFAFAALAAAAGGVRPVRWGLLAARGLLGGAAAFLYFEAIAQVGAGVATLLNCTHPIWAALLAATLLGEGIAPRLWAGLALTLAGMVGVVGAAQLGWSMGIALGLASAILGGAAVTSVRALRRTDGALVIFGSFSLFGALLSAPPAAHGWVDPGPAGWAWAIATGVAAAGAQLVFTDALGEIRAAEAAVVGQLTPVTSLFLGALLLGEPLSARALGGAALIVAGVALASVKPGPAPAPAPENGRALAPPEG